MNLAIFSTWNKSYFKAPRYRKKKKIDNPLYHLYIWEINFNPNFVIQKSIAFRNHRLLYTESKIRTQTFLAFSPELANSMKKSDITRNVKSLVTKGKWRRERENLFHPQHLEHHHEQRSNNIRHPRDTRREFTREQRLSIRNISGV